MPGRSRRVSGPPPAVTTSRTSCIKIDGNKATGRAYWFHYSNNNPERRGVFDGYGHYEDSLVKVNGQWLFSRRRIYNEQRKEWAFPERINPAW